MIQIVLFRDDLRLSDNPALWHAAARGPVLPVVIADPRESRGAAFRWWQYHSLRNLQCRLEKQGIPLVLRRGDPLQTVLGLLDETGARGVFWNRRYGSLAREQDQTLKMALRSHGVAAESFPGNLLAEPWEVLRKGDLPYQVFSPFWKAMQERIRGGTPLAQPKLTPPSPVPESEDPDRWGWYPRHPDWARNFLSFWEPGEPGAHKSLDIFLETALCCYRDGRDFPGRPCVSRLSPHLAHGEISPRQIRQKLLAFTERHPHLQRHTDSFLRELAWRKFSWHLLYHFPELPDSPLRKEFLDFPWAKNPEGLRRWQRGETGYPIVDAGMRELWQTGYLHNRVRMVVASFLVKDLLIPWQQGAAWFLDTLVDADPASNSASWQWIAGCGTDAAPYFRIFNPVIQAGRFDPDGTYVRRWLPELVSLPVPLLHKPWTGPEAVRAAGIQLGLDYPWPITDHSEARKAALLAFGSLRQQKGTKRPGSRNTPIPGEGS